MDFFNQMSEKVGEMKSTVRNIANDIAPSPEKTQLQNEEENLEKLFSKLGQYFYSTQKDSLPDECSDIVNGIFEVRHRIHHLKQKINAQSGIITCLKCNMDNPNTNRFCAGCGTMLPEKYTPFVPGEVLCQSCGNVIQPGKKFCTNCGTKVENDTPADVPIIAPVSDETEELPLIDISFINDTPQESAPAFCEECGEKLEDGAAFCISCGHKVAQ